jgi:hypothetical protein
MASFRYIWFFTLLLFAFLHTACFSQTVVIRIINLTNKHPVRKQRVYIWGISGKLALDEKDEQTGRAKFKLLTHKISPELNLITEC